MKVLQINTVYGEGSTGKIAASINDACKQHGIICLSAFRCTQKGQPIPEDAITISSKWDSRFHGCLSKFTMLKGIGSFFRTLNFLRKVKRYCPDIIHLHNLHGSYVNIPLLFNYIKKYRIPVVWTLHDCWAFTAICSHFVTAKCDKWKTGCHNCAQRKRFSSAPIDLTKSVWKIKKKWFQGVSNLTVVTPSHWLGDLVQNSFLKDYTVKTIYNGIDLDVFQYTESDFRSRYALENRKIVLGVAFDWGYSKGLDMFVELSERLDEQYQIVLVGTNEKVDRELPENIISIHRVSNQRELSAIYSVADVFVNPTREEVLGLVNIEALACGTPVVTFPTGGSPECIDQSCGVVVETDNSLMLEKEIIRICQNKPFSRESCRRRAMLFDKAERIEEYIQLYGSVLDGQDKKYNYGR